MPLAAPRFGLCHRFKKELKKRKIPEEDYSELRACWGAVRRVEGPAYALDRLVQLHMHGQQARCRSLLCSPLPAAVEPRLRYYELAAGSGAEAKDGSRVVVSRCCLTGLLLCLVGGCGLRPPAGATLHVWLLSAHLRSWP